MHPLENIFSNFPPQFSFLLKKNKIVNPRRSIIPIGGSPKKKSSSRYGAQAKKNFTITKKFIKVFFFSFLAKKVITFFSCRWKKNEEEFDGGSPPPKKMRGWYQQNNDNFFSVVL
jgi:hypothetical protein